MTALVSFPGSGNTWVRYLLETASGIFTGSIYIDRRIISKGTHDMKKESLYFISLIFISIITLFMNHFSYCFPYLQNIPVLTL